MISVDSIKEKIDNLDIDEVDNYIDAVKYAKESFKCDDISFELLEEYGREVIGDSIYRVHRVSDSESSIIIRFDGYYSSYDGIDIDPYSFREVKAVQKTITCYE